MTSLRFRTSLALAAALLTGGTAAAQGKFGEKAADFPAGTFSDGKRYQLEDLRGKVVVLFFYENECPRCKGLIPERNEVVKAFKDQPVKFLAVGAEDSTDSVAMYLRETGLAMPVFVDSLGLMQARYGQKISLKNIWQMRVIDPEGKIVGYDMSKEAIQKVVDRSKPKWKYKGDGYHAKLDPALDCFECGQYAAGAKLLAPLRRNANKEVADSANKLYAALKKEGEKWKDEADKAAASDPVKAYDLYGRIAAVFAGDEPAKAVATPLQQLQGRKAVSSELAARKAFAALEAKLSRAPAVLKPALLKESQALAKKYPDTPTAEKASALAKELAE